MRILSSHCTVGATISPGGAAKRGTLQTVPGEERREGDLVRVEKEKARASQQRSRNVGVLRQQRVPRFAVSNSVLGLKQRANLASLRVR